MSIGSGETEACVQHVLVIEDEAKMARLVVRAISAAGFDSTTEATGLGGMEQLRSRTFDLVVLDLLLPDIDGFSVLASATELDWHPPLLVLSALADVRSKVACLELGACDYITKPFEVGELIARVRLRARECHAVKSPRSLRCGRYVLDLQRRVVQNGGPPVHLTTREFLLLEYLMSRQGEACSREELLEHVWGYAFDPGTNIVDVCIGRLRQKLGGNCVATVRNVGYYFVGA